MTEQPIDFEQVEAMGISREAFDEVLDIVGRIPTMEELSTLLAMWESNGRQQSLYGWLRGQRHTVERNEYLYTGTADHRSVREPRVKDCLTIANELCHNLTPAINHLTLTTGLLLYMVGNVSTEFADSEYARRCLHLVSIPKGAGGHREDCQYIEMILDALLGGDIILTHQSIAYGGLFCSLLQFTSPLGYDILSAKNPVATSPSSTNNMTTPSSSNSPKPASTAASSAAPPKTVSSSTASTSAPHPNSRTKKSRSHLRPLKHNRKSQSLLLLKLVISLHLFAVTIFSLGIPATRE